MLLSTGLFRVEPYCKVIMKTVYRLAPSLKLKITALIFAFLSFATMLMPVSALAATGPCPQNGIFGIPPWYKYLECEDNVPQVESAGPNGPEDIWLIVAAVLEAMMRIGSFLAIIYIMWAGYVYITSAGAPDKTAQARKQIINAVAGLAITIVASAVVNQAVGILKPSGNAVADTATIIQGLRMAYAIGGGLAVVMIVIGGLKFITATGDPSGITSARNTIIYALIGLVVVLLASAITSFTIGRV